MSRMLLLLFAALSIPHPAQACTRVMLWPPVEELVKTSQAVVRARPLEIANSRTYAASGDNPAYFTQTIRWQVIDSWKGPYTIDKTFVTQQRLVTGTLCGDDDFIGKTDTSARLVYLFGSEPFSKYSSTTAPRPEEVSYFREHRARGI